MISQSRKTRWILLSLIALVIVIFYVFDGHSYLSFDYIKSHLNEIQLIYDQKPLLVIGLFLACYLFLTSLSIPGSIVLTILSGAVFGTSVGVILVSLAGTAGATIAFLFSRYIFKESMEERFSRKLRKVNESLNRESILYLFTLRLIPVSPFVVINLVLGVTNLSVWTFFWTTFLGMLPGNWIYAFAGKQIGEIESPEEIMNPTFIIGLTLLGLLPLLTKKIIKMRKKRMAHV